MKKVHSFVIEGQGGAAKTPITEAVCKNLEKETGLLVRGVAPFAKARDYLGGRYLSVYKLFTEEGESGAVRAELMLSDILEEESRIFRRQLEDSVHGEGVIIYDRHWLTVLCSLEDATFKTPGLRESLIEKWTKNVPPSFFLDAPTSVIRSRKGANEIPWAKSNDLLEVELKRRRDLFMKYRGNFISEPIWINNSRVDLACICDDILSKIRSTLCWQQNAN